MIGRLEGVLREKSPTRALLDVGGVGYEVLIPLSTFAELPDEGKVVALRIHTHVREDAFQLFAFRSRRERSVFELLLHASRVGPKLALTVLSGIDAEDLLVGIRNGDIALLQSIPGIGRRMAERIVVELRERAQDLCGSSSPGAEGGRSQARRTGRQELLLEEIASALSNLGVARSQAERAARSAFDELGVDEPIGSLVRTALRGLAR